MKQPAVILIVPVLCNIVHNTGIASILPESSSICNTDTDTGKYQYPTIFQYLQYQKILVIAKNMSIADTGRFWEILVIPVLQILEDSGKYWLYQYCRYWKIRQNSGQPEFICLHYTKRIEYNSYSYVISAVHNIRGKSPVMSKYFVWPLIV